MQTTIYCAKNENKQGRKEAYHAGKEKQGRRGREEEDKVGKARKVVERSRRRRGGQKRGWGQRPRGEERDEWGE